MNTIDNLERKIRMAADQLKSLKAEKEKLRDEVSFLREENKKLKELSEDNSTWITEKRHISNKIEKVLKKINSMGISQ